MKLRIISLGLALAALAMPGSSSATVTNVIGWWHFGEGATPQTGVSDSTNNINFRSAFSFQPNAGSVLVPPLISPEAVGGPLGTNGGTNFTFSTRSLRFGLNATQSSFWNTVTNPPLNNYAVELWFMPQNKGVTGGSVTWIFSTGGGQVALSGTNNVWGGEVIRLKDNFDGTSSLQAGVVIGPNSTDVLDFGPPILADTNRWIHLALVNDAGVLGFYTNGVLVATNNTGISFPAAGAMYIGTDGDNQAIDGFIDEERLFRFAPGTFSSSDFLLRPLPGIITQPATNTAVWNGGAEILTVGVVRDPANIFQWKLGTTNIGANSNILYRPVVTTTDNGGIYTCVVSNSNYTNSLTTSNALLTIVAVQTNNANAYKSTITNEPGLVAYFPMDGSSSSSTSNVVDNTRNGSLEGNAMFDGRTNRSFGERAISINGDGDIQIPSNPNFEFGGGNGTVEALVYLTTPTVPGYVVPGNLTLFSVASSDGLSVHYKIQVSSDGGTLFYTNDSPVQLSWAIPTSLLNRLAHVAVVFSNGTNVTPYVDGVSLGGKFQASFGSGTSIPAWIGSATTNVQDMWVGSIDDVAIYNTALSANTVAIHNSKFLFGTNTTAPVITSQPPSATLYTGGSPVLVVTTTGTPPLAYQWKTNGVNISGATNATLTLSNTTTNSSATYTVNVSNPINPAGTNSSNIVLTFVAPPAGYAAKVMGDHPTAFWRLDELGGTNMTDYSGVFNGSYLTNTTNLFTLGVPGAIVGDADTAVLFTNGSRGEVPYYAALNPNGPFTVEFWANPRTLNAVCPLSTQFRTGAARNGFNITQNNGGPGWTLQMGNGGGVTIQIVGVSPITINNWFHVAVTWDGAGTARLYVDGELDGVSSNNAASAYVPNPSAPFDIGVRNGIGIPYYGTVDEVAFYNYVLPQSNLQAHVNIGLPLTVSITTASNVVSDSKSVGLAYDGRITGSSWQASNFDGTNTRNGVMQFTNNPQSQILTFGYTNFDSPHGTIAFWMRSAGTAGAGAEGAVLFHRRPGGGGAGVAIIQNDGTTNGFIHIQGANSVPNIFSPNSVSDNKWHHVVVAFDQTVTGYTSLYMDGALVVSNANVAPYGWTPGASLQFGRDTLYDGGFFRTYNGAMDDIRIYNRALTDAEVSSVYTSDAIVDASALVVRYNFDAPPAGYNINWTFGTLQSAPLAPGTYTDLFPVQFKPFPIAPHPGQRFFRARQ